MGRRAAFPFSGFSVWPRASIPRRRVPMTAVFSHFLFPLSIYVPTGRAMEGRPVTAQGRAEARPTAGRGSPGGNEKGVFYTSAPSREMLQSAPPLPPVADELWLAAGHKGEGRFLRRFGKPRDHGREATGIGVRARDALGNVSRVAHAPNWFPGSESSAHSPTIPRSRLTIHCRHMLGRLCGCDFTGIFDPLCSST